MTSSGATTSFARCEMETENQITNSRAIGNYYALPSFSIVRDIAALMIMGMVVRTPDVMMITKFSD